MKRIDLLIQLVKNIYTLLKNQSEASCPCAVLASNDEAPVDRQELSCIVQILKNIEAQMHVSNELAIDHYNSNVKAISPKEPEEVLRKHQVIEILKISDRTYYRHIENGVLVPRQLGGRSFFYHSDLAAALEYSRVRGYL